MKFACFLFYSLPLASADGKGISQIYGFSQTECITNKKDLRSFKNFASLTNC